MCILKNCSWEKISQFSQTKDIECVHLDSSKIQICTVFFKTNFNFEVQICILSYEGQIQICILPENQMNALNVHFQIQTSLDSNPSRTHVLVKAMVVAVGFVLAEQAL